MANILISIRTHRRAHTIFNMNFTHQKKKMEIKKMELLTVVLTILADGGFVLQCLVIGDNKEICLEDVEVLEFLFLDLRRLVSVEEGFLV